MRCKTVAIVAVLGLALLATAPQTALATPQEAQEAQQEAQEAQQEQEEQQAQEQEASLYDRLGGIYPIALVVDDFIDRLMVNDVLNANPRIAEARDPQRLPGLKYRVSELVCQVTGGPCTYTGKSMAEAHAGMNITEAEWQAMADDFKASLDKFGVGEREQEELFAIVATTKGDIVVTEPAQ